MAHPDTTDEENCPRTTLRNTSGLGRQAVQGAMPYLVVVEGSECGKMAELGLDPVHVGRRGDNQLALADPFVSAHHCTVAFEAGRIWVTDLDSSNGTFIDGQPVEGRAPWPAEASLQVGNQILRQEYRRRAEMRRSSELAEDLRRAASYVQTLLPSPLDCGEVRTRWHFVPSAGLSGDIFDYFWLDGGRFVFYLLDVCGHGTGSALHSVSVFNLLRQRSLPGVDFARPAQVLKALNDALPMQGYGDLYFTLWYGVYHVADRRLDFASGGHPPALLFDGTGPHFAELRTPNPPLGIATDLDYQEKTIELRRGSLLYLFSDGVYEISTAGGELWGWEDYVRFLEERLKSGQGQPEAIFRGIKELTAEGRFEDDFSLLLLRFGGG